MIGEENDNDNNNDNYFNIKLNSNITAYSISAFNDDASTYLGVKSVNEEQSIRESEINDKKQKNKNNKFKKKKSFSSITESVGSESDSSKEKKKSSNKINKQKKVNEEKKNYNKENDKKDEQIETLFEWDGGGELVYITGSFCDWKDFYKMNKNKDGKFHLSLFLPRGFHQYKFKVDENWEYSKNHPKFEENGNINNFIDTTDYETENELKDDNNKEIKAIENEEAKEQEKSEEKTHKKVKNKSTKKKKKIKKRLSSIHTVNFLNSQHNYTIYYPLKSELNIKPSSLPCLYKAHFILNEDFKPKKEKKFTKVAYVNDESEDESSESSSSSSISDTSSEPSSKISVFGEIIPYVKFQNLYHIHSNHLHSKMRNYNYSTIISMTSRYRIKFSTFIYYRPKPNKSKEVKRRVKHSKTVKIKNKIK